jgi:hypothetical protein
MQESVYLESTGLGATPMQTLPFFVMVAYLQQPRHAEQLEHSEGRDPFSFIN